MANLLYRASSSAAIPGSTTVKGSALTNTEIDGNFRSINTAKLEVSDAVSTNTINKVVLRDGSGNFAANVITATLSGTATSVSNTLTRGTYLTGNNFNGSAATTWAVDATSANTVSKVVARDANGDFAGRIISVVDLNSTSDRKYKDNIAPISDALSLVNSIDGVSFDWKSDGKSSFGVIAQELQQVLPQLVSEMDDGLTVSYIPIIAILIEAVKQQQKQIEELQSRVL